MLWLELLIGTTIAWIVGLLPALVARYAWVKAPLKRQSATWIAGVWCAVFWLLFRILNTAAAEAGDQPSNKTGFVWLFIFFVSRWIMTRGSSEPVEEDEPKTKRKLTRTEMIEGLNQIMLDPTSSPQVRAKAEKRLRALEADGH